MRLGKLSLVPEVTLSWSFGHRRKVAHVVGEIQKINMRT